MIEKSLVLSIGAKLPFKLLHISDTHLVYADSRDGDRKIKLAANRARHFRNAEANLFNSTIRAKKENALIVHTGDLIDFVSEKNLDAARAFTFDNDCFMCAGNHEFSQYVGEAKEDAAYRNQSLARVQACFQNNIRFSVREINGVKLVAIDNSYYLFEQEQLDALKAEASDGKPMILLMHNPLYSQKLHQFVVDATGNPVSYLCGAPEEVLLSYPSDRYIQQKPDDITLETIAFIKACPNIKAILAGHIHRDVDDMLTPTLPQYCCGLETSVLITVQ